MRVLLTGSPLYLGAAMPRRLRAQRGGASSPFSAGSGAIDDILRGRTATRQARGLCGALGGRSNTNKHNSRCCGCSTSRMASTSLVQIAERAALPFHAIQLPRKRCTRWACRRSNGGH